MEIFGITVGAFAGAFVLYKCCCEEDSGDTPHFGDLMRRNNSDRRLKRNITRIESAGALDMIKSLTGVSFTFKTDEFPLMNLDPKEQVGFIAQDVEKVLPQVVYTVNDYKRIEYDKVTAVLVEAVKQQAEDITQLRASLEEESKGELAGLKAENEELRKELLRQEKDRGRLWDAIRQLQAQLPQAI